MAAFIRPQRGGGDSDRLMAVPAGELVRMMPLNKLPPAEVDIAEIRHKYHAAAARQARRGHNPTQALRKK